jgi:hypothetical protein
MTHKQERGDGKKVLNGTKVRKTFLKSRTQNTKLLLINYKYYYLPHFKL